MNENSGSLTHQVRGILEGGSSQDQKFITVLDALLRHFNCVVGTIHVLDSGTKMLMLKAHRGIPEVIMDKVKMIPIGKGMAGLAAERKAPVQVCNLQSDNSGVAKPGAKETRMEGSIAAPIIIDGELKGTLGVAKPSHYEFSDAESNLLMEVGKMIGKYF